RNRGDGTFERIRDSTTDRAGWAWGSAFLDLDNDSDLDLYVANGWISAARDTDL
ncbi:MAG: VCBS repeat-containing protein, partial [Acidobacteria bacterium]|nr:VCBS repeat-containing protein [Acidobacteriota bacterium]